MKKCLLLLSYCFIFLNTYLDAQTVVDFFPQDMMFCPELTGRIVFPGHPSYNEARLVSNYYTSKNKYPHVIVYCKTTQDVQNAIKWARCHDLSIRIRSGGHNHEAFSTGNGIMLIDVREMRELQLDKSTNIATLQPGLNNKELYTQLFNEGFTHVGGTCSDVGISGLTLSGGMGPLLRKVGLTCDSLISFEMVNANGEIIHATKDNEYKDLFWATCGGGGGNFGVITSLKIKVFPAPNVTWFNIGWDWDQPVEQIILAWQDFFAKPDKKWFSHLDLWSKPFPSREFKKQPIKILGMYWGPPEEAKKELAPLLHIGKPNVHDIEYVSWLDAIKLIEESTAVFITSKPEYRSPGAYVNQNLPAEAVKTIVTTLRNSTSELLNVLMFTLSGTAVKVAPAETAYFYRDAKFFVSYTLQWLNTKDDKRRIKEVTQLRQNLLPYTVGDYVGNPDPSIKDYLTAYYGDNARKLRCVKRKYDPKNLFRHEQSIPPAPLLWKCEG
jgi:hypothetical protein